MIESSWFKLDEERPIAINKLLHTLDNVPHKFEDAVFGGFGDAVSESERLLNILRKLERTFSSRIIGQAELVRMVLVAMVLNEHALLEGLPGVGKTEIVKWIAQVSGLPFSRVQFIPDMLPSDLIGKDHVDIAKLGSKDPDAVHWVNGPIFSCIVLADEINRAPSKVQAALLEAMGERQVTPFGKLSRPVLSPLHEGALRAGGPRGLADLPGAHGRRDGNQPDVSCPNLLAGRESTAISDQAYHATPQRSFETAAWNQAVFGSSLGRRAMGSR